MSYQLTETSFLPLTPPNEPSIAIDCPPNRRLYCLAIRGHGRSSANEEEYGEYITKNHSQLFKDLMTKYGLVRWTQTHSTTETRSLVGKEHDTQSTNDADIDWSSQFMSESMDSLVRMKQDPLFNASLRDVDEHFPDATRTKITMGYVEEFTPYGIFL